MPIVGLVQMLMSRVVRGARASGRVRRRCTCASSSSCSWMSPPAEKARPGAGEDDAADRVVGLEPLQRVVQLAAELAVHRVELLGPVQREDADAVFDVGQDRFVVIASPSTCRLDPSVLARDVAPGDIAVARRRRSCPSSTMRCTCAATRSSSGSLPTSGEALRPQQRLDLLARPAAVETAAGRRSRRIPALVRAFSRCGGAEASLYCAPSMIASRPPGRSTRIHSSIAASGCGRVHSTCRLITRSKLPAG